MFCKLTWNGLHILPDGYIRLCAIGANSKPELDLQRCRDKNGNHMHILTHEIKEIMNSDKHREVRKLNMANPTEWSPHCECCRNREVITNFDRDHPNKSRRFYLMKFIDEDGGAPDFATEHNYMSKADPDGYIDYMPSSLDIRFGNLCNQKCVMCSPSFSNLWYGEWFDYFQTNKFGQSKQIIVHKDEKTKKWIEPDVLNWFEDPRWWKKFEEMMPYLKHIYITGGEPMVAPAHGEMLDRLISAGYAENIWLEYDSNCSAINPKLIRRWYEFKKVHIRGSMDAIKDQYEVIRFGGKWEKFVDNVKILKDLEKKSSKQIRLLSLSSCFQIPNMFSILESEEFCKSLDVNFHLRFLEGPERLAVASLPDSAKKELIEYYTKNKEKSTKADMIITHLNTHLGEEFYKPEAVKNYVKFMDYLDNTRNLNWRNIFPEVAEMINKVVL